MARARVREKCSRELCSDLEQSKKIGEPVSSVTASLSDAPARAAISSSRAHSPSEGIASDASEVAKI